MPTYVASAAKGNKHHALSAEYVTKNRQQTVESNEEKTDYNNYERRQQICSIRTYSVTGTYFVIHNK